MISINLRTYCDIRDILIALFLLSVGAFIRYVRKCVKVPIYNFVVTDTIMISYSDDCIYIPMAAFSRENSSGILYYDWFLHLNRAKNYQATNHIEEPVSAH